MILKIKKSSESADLENDFANGLNVLNVIYSTGRLMEFYTEFFSGSASVTEFKYQILSISDAKSGRINILTDTSISTANLKESVRGSHYQLYYDGASSTLTNKLVRYVLKDNGTYYVSEPFIVV